MCCCSPSEEVNGLLASKVCVYKHGQGKGVGVVKVCVA